MYIQYIFFNVHVYEYVYVYVYVYVYMYIKCLYNVYMYLLCRLARILYRKPWAEWVTSLRDICIYIPKIVSPLTG